MKLIEKHVLNRYKLIIIAYIICCVLAILININPIRRWFIDLWNEDYFFSFHASLVEDLLFFGIIGSIAMFITSKNPEDDIFESRIKSLANNPGVSEDAREQLKDELRNSLAYCKESKTHIKISNYLDSDDTIEVFCNQTSQIFNMCKDIDFIFDEGFEVEPYLPRNGDYGYISNMSVTDDNNSDIKWVIVEDDILRLDSNKKNVWYVEDFKIPKNSSATRKLCFSSYGPLGTNEDNLDDWLELSNHKFTSNAQLSIENNSDIPILCSLKHNNKGSTVVLNERLRIDSGKEVVVYETKKLGPRDSIYLYFCKP